MHVNIKDTYRSERYARTETCPIVSGFVSHPHSYPAPWKLDYDSKQVFDLVCKNKWHLLKGMSYLKP